MASRAARAIFSAAARASARPTRVAHQIGRRHNSTSSHGSSATSSDTPWIIGSVLVFGPALLYLLSPSARQKTAAHTAHGGTKSVHTSGHESTIETPVHTEVKMKDDEGTEQTVTESLVIAEQEDVPKVGKAIHEGEELADPNVSATPGIAKTEPETIPDETAGEGGSGKIGTMKDPGEEAPAGPGVASASAKEDKA